MPPPKKDAPPTPLLGWLAPYLEGGMDLLRGATGLGDQGPPGPTWTNAGALLAAAAPFVPGKLTGLKALATGEQATEAALDLSRAARWQRAAEQGYGPLMYHETEASNLPGLMQGFDLNRVGARAQDEIMPNGVFLKPTDKRIHVAQDPTQVALQHRGQNLLHFQTRDELEQFLLRDPHYAEQHQALQANERRYIAEFDALDKIAWRSDAPEAVAARDRLDSLMDEWKATNSEIAARARARATDLLRASGADGIRVVHDPGSFNRTVDTTVIFDPAKVRHPAAAFDPRQLANPNLLAGIGGGGILLSRLAPRQPESR
jgi:hypothetical protein